MKKKAIKLATSTAIAATAFVAAAPANQADAAVNVDQLVQDAQNAGTVLKWAISVEGSADGVTRPWAQYNNAKEAIAKAEAAVKGASFSDKLKYEARLTDPKIQVKRAQAYIDAITSSEKIKDLTANLNSAISSNDLDKVEAAYHKATAEYRKQTVLLDRVYGQSTRDQIRDAVKPALEKLVASVKNEVTVHMHANAAAADVKAGKYEDAAKKLADAQAILNANALKWESALQKSVDDVNSSLPLAVAAVTRLDSKTVQVKLTKAVDVAPVAHFAFDKGLEVTATSLSADGKTVTLTTSGEKPGETYTLSYKGTVAKSFTAPVAPPSNDPIVGTNDAVRQDTGTYRTYTFNLKNTDNSVYNGKAGVMLYDANTNKELADKSVAEIYSVNGTLLGSNLDWNDVVKDGKITVIIKGTAAGSVKPVVYIDKDGNGEYSTGDFKLDGGKTIFHAEAADRTFNKVELTYVDSSDYFVAQEVTTTDGVATKGVETKFKYDDGDIYQINGYAVTKENFKKALSQFDELYVNYQTPGTSIFNITKDVNTASLNVTNPNGNEVRVYNNYYVLRGTGDAGKTIRVYSDDNKVVATTTVASNGTWSAQVNLDRSDLNNLTIGQYYTDSNQLTPGGTASVTVVEGAFKLNTVDAVNDGDDVLGLGDELEFTFSKIGSYQDIGNFADGAKIEFTDADGTVAEFTVGTKGTEVVTNGAGTVEVTLGLPVIKDKGGDGVLNADKTVWLTNLTGITNEYNMKLNFENKTLNVK